VDAQPQHHLIVGARGMGKTTLLQRLRFAIEDDDSLRDRCLGLTFPEEQYNVASLADLWLNSADALADQLQASGRSEIAEEIDRAIVEIQDGTEDGDAGSSGDERRDRALALLRDVAKRIGRRLVLLIDNIDLVFDRLEKEQWTLREVLSAEPWIQLIGASSAPLESYYRHDRAFYDFFRVEHLHGLSEDETFAMLRKLADIAGSERVARVLDEQPARIKTLRLMAGGNPRTIVVLFGLLSQGIDGDARTDVERLLDACTPLYKHRIEVLSVQAQRVLDGVAMHWFPATAAELARTVRLDVNKISTHLNRLVKDGTLEKVTLPDTKKHGFQLAERFFNIWYLMRSSRRVRRRLGWFVDFLRLMLSPEELTHRAREHMRGLAAGDPLRHAEMSIAYAGAVDGAPLRHALESDSLRSLCADPSHRRRLAELFDLDGEDSVLRDRTSTLATILVARGEWEEARPWAAQFLSTDDQFLTEVWISVLAFFRETVSSGFASEARELLREVGARERWEPLDRALDLLARHDLPAIGRLAPEMRTAVRLVLAAIAPDAEVPES
ncbi:MAG: ATP-binding protein, partial [Nannocystaceae bacterium]|nr:ATP-binding protein [Nannocystaceae bacterium]